MLYNEKTLKILEDGTLWGCGSNKYGQLGESRKKLAESKEFISLEIDLGGKCIKDFKCQEWGIYLFTPVE